MNLEEIITAVDNGLTVHWSSDSYKVIKDSLGQFLIKHSSGHCIGLTWEDGKTMNGKKEKFYIK